MGCGVAWVKSSNVNVVLEEARATWEGPPKVDADMFMPLPGHITWKTLVQFPQQNPAKICANLCSETTVHSPHFYRAMH